MKETKCLYDLDPYQLTFDAEVLQCETIDVEGMVCYQIVLDQTLFFPEQGGQSADKGCIDGSNVLDVQIKQHIIYHTVDQPFECGQKIHGTIDWNHRFSNMQQHTGEHIFSGLVHKKFGYDNVGFHLSDQTVTMDFNGPISTKEVEELEREANEVIVSNVPVRISYPSKEELFVLDYRSKIEIEGQVRIVTIPNVDQCACCAPHVKQTGEIGLLKVISVQSHRGGVRISILCGMRALNDYRGRIATTQTLSSLLSVSHDKLVEAVERQKEQLQTAKFERNQLKQQYMELKLTTIPNEQEHVYLFEDELEQQVMRTTVNILTEHHDGFCGVFSGNEIEGYRFIIGSKEQDARTVIAAMKEQFEVRGGGSNAMVQGSVIAKKEDLLKQLNCLSV